MQLIYRVANVYMLLGSVRLLDCGLHRDALHTQAFAHVQRLDV